MLNDKDIEKIVEIANNANPDAINMDDIKDKVEVNPDAEPVIGEVINNDSNVGVATEAELTEIDKIAQSYENGISLFDIDENGNADIDNTKAIEASANGLKNALELSDDDVFKVINVINNMKDNPNYPVFANLPEKMQTMISKLGYENKVPISGLDKISRLMMEELIDEAGLDNSLIDLEKALDQALNIPSVLDLYTEHTKEIMDKTIPETIEKIKDEFPEKAAKLEAVRESFKHSYDFSYAKNAYETSSKIRKAVRRYDLEFNRTLDKFNYINEKSNFKMNDVCQIPDVLKKVLIDDPSVAKGMYNTDGEELPDMENKLLDMKVNEIDIKKFCIFICKPCENMIATDVIDASYMYYMTRNIIALKHTNECKTGFAVELINNICDIITFIRSKESEFNESGNSSKAMHGGKHQRNKN